MSPSSKEIDPVVVQDPLEPSSKSSAMPGAVCPTPIFDHKQVVLGHGSGGKLTAELIEKVFLPAFTNPILERLDDQAVLEIGGSRLAFTTDSFVVTPIFFCRRRYR